MSCVTQTKNFNTLWTKQAVIETAFKIIVFLASVGHPDMWTGGSKISVQSHIFIMHVVISDTYMHNKSMGCTEIILNDPGADSGGKGKSKRAKKNGAKNYLSLRHLYRLFRVSLAPTIYPWVSEDIRKSDLSWNFKIKMIFIKYFPFCWSEMLRDWELQCSVYKSAITDMAFNLTNEEALTVLCFVVKHTGKGWSTKELQR